MFSLDDPNLSSLWRELDLLQLFRNRRLVSCRNGWSNGRAAGILAAMMATFRSSLVCRSANIILLTLTQGSRTRPRSTEARRHLSYSQSFVVR